jgi:putative redox protein
VTAPMAKPPLSIELRRIGPAAFRAVAGSGGELVVDGSADIGGENRGMRPMELLLSAVASCASMDVVSILTKQREPLADLEVHAEGVRRDATPAPFTEIRLRFVAHGGVSAHKLERAVALAVQKYCSVAESLDDAIRITHVAEARPAPAG